MWHKHVRRYCCIDRVQLLLKTREKLIDFREESMRGENTVDSNNLQGGTLESATWEGHSCGSVQT